MARKAVATQKEETDMLKMKKLRKSTPKAKRVLYWD